jgi:hypothetical protein
MLQQTWEQTHLWNSVVGRGNAVTDAMGRVRLFMKDAENVLAKGETAPADFTLHDEEHGYRVAQRMAEMIGEARLREFSATELILLLASAYLHDIGMTPKREHVRAHRDFLLTGEEKLLTSDERAHLQAWLDDWADGAVPPLAKGTPDSATLARVDELLTYYCRSKHNDWSELWIKENISGDSDRELYQGFSDDLMQLCRSHHEGYAKLIGARFDAKLVGSDIVHPRYHAALLRIADILEFDPERTPEVIFRHRGVSPSSTIYWHKDHEVSFHCDGGYFIFFGRPKSAAIFQALRQMANEIDAELATCALMAKEGRFQLAPLRTGNDPRYEWHFEPMLKRDLHPKDGAFEEFEGAFQPNPRRLLALLADTQLYENRLAAVRELLQNAFDAVREQIALQRLAEIERWGTSDEAAIAARHFVILDLHQNGSQWELVCTDSGVGMTREILRKRFLTSGSTRGHRERDLERRCASAGFKLMRTGEFGIGALSYFMLADRMELTTYRSPHAGDFDNAWIFAVGGLNDFGELTKAPNTEPGTAVRLRLKSDLMQKGVEAFALELEKYLRRTVSRVPCRFEYRVEQTVKFSSPPGWTRSLEDLTAFVAPEFDMLGLYFSDSNRQRPWGVDRTKLRWATHEGRLPDEAGHYRIHLPWFELPGGDSVPWASIKEENGGIEIGGYFHLNSHEPIMSWLGMAVHESSNEHACLIEIDCTDSSMGRISVSRSSVKWTEEAKDILQDIRVKKQTEVTMNWLETHVASPFCAVSAASIAGHLPTSARPYWPTQTSDNKTLLIPIHFPATSSRVGRGRHFKFRNRDVQELNVLGAIWSGTGVTASHMAGNKANIRQIVPIWEHATNREPVVEFPPQWADILAIRLYDAGGVSFNSRHALVKGKHVTPPSRLEKLPRKPADIPSDPHEGLLLFFQTLMSWDDRFLEDEWRAAFWPLLNAVVERPMSRLIMHFDGTVVTWTETHTETMWTGNLADEQVQQYLPQPDPDWLCEEVLTAGDPGV